MPKPLVVSIPHHLGRKEAERRLADGITFIRDNYGKKVSILHEQWDGDRLSFEVAVLGQKASGTIDFADDQVTVSVTLPMLLALMAEKAKTLIQKEGTLLLEKK